MYLALLGIGIAVEKHGEGGTVKIDREIGVCGEGQKVLAVRFYGERDKKVGIEIDLIRVRLCVNPYGIREGGEAFVELWQGGIDPFFRRKAVLGFSYNYYIYYSAIRAVLQGLFIDFFALWDFKNIMKIF